MNPPDRYCSYNKNNLSHEKNIKDIICGDFATKKVLIASQQKYLPVARLNADLCFGGLKQTELPDIEGAVEFICRRDNSLLLEYIYKLSDVAVVLEINGGFSSLLTVAGSEYIFRQLKRREEAVLSAINRINLYTVE